jgi:1-acyl-sn-glycerol-3-phosphate acyltransferase
MHANGSKRTVDGSQDIPLPHFKSYMHQRIPLPPKDYEKKRMRDASDPHWMKVIHSLLTRTIQRLKLFRPKRLWLFYTVVMKLMRRMYILTKGMEVYGKANIPKEGGIFLINHPAGIDVVFPFMAVFQNPLGVFTDMGDHFLTDLAEHIGIVPRIGLAPVMIEKMIRQIALKNRYFAIWPEGTPDKGQGVMQGFSGIVRVYATLNASRNRIPFVPVVMHALDQNGMQYTWQPLKNMKAKLKYHKGKKRKYYKGKRHGVKKVIFHILEPEYLPQAWLQPPDNGGKSQREIIDYLMLKIAVKMGQKTLAPNPAVNNRKTHSDKPWH